MGTVEKRDRHVFEHRSERIRTLRSISPISYAVERVFHLLARFSPERLAGPTRVRIQLAHADTASRLSAARRRGRRVEAYLGVWLAIETVAVVFGTTCRNPWITGIFTVLAAGRILDIIQITGNISLFDRLKINWRYYYLENTVRTVLLSLVNYLEFILCFGFIYCVAGRGGRLLLFPESAFDGYYFSGATQLTIGYGDIAPHGWVKYLALFQGFLGFLYAILILGRFISLLPESMEEG
jgi:potassium channel LctB